MHKYPKEASNLKSDPSDFIKNRYKFKSLRFYQNEQQDLSNKGKYTQITSIASFDSLDIEDSYFSSILNRSGVLQVDTLILDIDAEYGYLFIGEKFYNNNSDSSSKSVLAVNYDTQKDSITSTFKKTNRSSTLSLNSTNYIKFRLPDTNSNGSYSQESNNIPNKKSQKYKSGGKKRKFKGVSWNRNYLIYASLGAKSVHKTKKLGVYWKSRADVITLNTNASWIKSFDLLPFNNISQTLKVSLEDILSTADINNLISQLPLVAPGGKIERAIKNIKITVIKDRSTNMFNLDIRFLKDFKDTEFNSKKVIKRFDFRTAIFSTQSGIKKFSKKFDLEHIKSTHSMNSDGYNFNFKTQKQ